jgi:hypothetical protein
MPQTLSSRPGRRPNLALHQLWQQRLGRFQQSGLSVSAFCANEGLSPHSFYAWRRRLQPTSSAHDIDPPRFVPIRLSNPATPVEVVLISGTVLRLPPGCDLAFVRSLVEALGGAPC